MNKYAILLILLFTLDNSCQKYLDVKPKGVLLPEKLSDYEGLLNAPTMTKTFPNQLLDFTDDLYNPVSSQSQSPVANGYFWRPILTVNEKANPEIWGPLYRSIYSANVIISGVREAIDGTPAQKEAIRAEALVIRAGCYLDLLTVFARAYNPSTAESDPGLPLVSSTDVTDKVPPRSSLRTTLQSLIDDVSGAIDALPLENLNRYRITRHTAYALLSRIYLYMANFQEAKKYTELALEREHQFINYNNYTVSTQFPIYELSPEVLWQRAGIGGAPLFMLYSEDLQTYFEASDLRYVFPTLTTVNGLTRSAFPGVYNFGITFPELHLTLAEILAREGKADEAMGIVNNLRYYRIKADSYIDQSAASAEEALKKVLAERRRELAFSGLRWYDMKRLDREGQMPEVKRINKATGQVEATLMPQSLNYTFEIPIRVSLFNPEMELNHP